MLFHSCRFALLLGSLKVDNFISREVVVQSRFIRRPGNDLIFCRGLFLRLSRRALHQQTVVNEAR